MKDYSLVNTVFVINTFGVGTKKSINALLSLKEKSLLDKNLNDIDLSKKNAGLSIGDFLPAEYVKAQKTVDHCLENNIQIITFFDKLFPDSLRKIDQPPVALFVCGNMPDFNILPSITVVGPRNPSNMGLRYSRRLSLRFSRSGMLVVSGGGAGCETQVFLGSLSKEGKTVVILPCGFDYDHIDRRYIDEILEKGCIISEFPPKTPTFKYNYPMRNRIMAGISLMTVVVEARENSGALITAEKAMSYSRDVYVIPGNPSQKEYKGSNMLLLNGAKPLIDIKTIFNEYKNIYSDKIDIKKAFERDNDESFQKNNSKIIKISKETLSNEAKMLYNYLDKPIFSIDDLSSLELSTDEILSAITELELEGVITPFPGGKYKLK